MIDIDKRIDSMVRPDDTKLIHPNLIAVHPDDLKQLIRDVLEEVKPDEIHMVNPDAQAGAYINGYGKAVYNFEKKAGELRL